MNKRSSIVLLSLVPALSHAQSPPQGEWEAPFWFGEDQSTGADATRAIHMIHIFDGSVGKILAINENWDGEICPPGSDFPPADRARVWTPPPMGSPPGDPGVFEPVPLCRKTLFCSGHSGLADGTVLFTAGGLTSAGSHPQADIFDPAIMPSAASWNNSCIPPDLNERRWYPTATTLGDGTVLIMAGTASSVHVRIPELFDPAAGTCGAWQELPDAERFETMQPVYPYMFLLPDGNVIDASPRESRILDTQTQPWTWGPVISKPSIPPPRPARPGSAVMYEPGKIMISGGGPQFGPARKTTWVLDATNPNQGWLLGSEMNKARRNHDLVVMPDGKVLCVGGNDSEATIGPVYETEIFEPGAGNAAWTLQPSIAVGHERWYHSSAILLQDGRVAACGGNNRRTGQIFRPPYITSGAPRPDIVDAPISMSYDVEYVIEYVQNGGPVVTRACLTRLGSVTHGFDQDQRRVPLEITGGSDGGPLSWASVKAPANGNIAPPGYYMLWILNEYANNQFAPCELAAYVRVGP